MPSKRSNRRWLTKDIGPEVSKVNNVKLSDSKRVNSMNVVVTKTYDDKHGTEEKFDVLVKSNKSNKRKGRTSQRVDSVSPTKQRSKSVPRMSTFRRLGVNPFFSSARKKNQNRSRTLSPSPGQARKDDKAELPRKVYRGRRPTEVDRANALLAKASKDLEREHFRGTPIDLTDGEEGNVSSSRNSLNSFSSAPPAKKMKNEDGTKEMNGQQQPGDVIGVIGGNNSGFRSAGGSSISRTSHLDDEVHRYDEEAHPYDEVEVIAIRTKSGRIAAGILTPKPDHHRGSSNSTRTTATLSSSATEATSPSKRNGPSSATSPSPLPPPPEILQRNSSLSSCNSRVVTYPSVSSSESYLSEVILHSPSRPASRSTQDGSVEWEEVGNDVIVKCPPNRRLAQTDTFTRECMELSFSNSILESKASTADRTYSTIKTSETSRSGTHRSRMVPIQGRGQETTEREQRDDVLSVDGDVWQDIVAATREIEWEMQRGGTEATKSSESLERVDRAIKRIRSHAKKLKVDENELIAAVLWELKQKTKHRDKLTADDEERDGPPDEKEGGGIEEREAVKQDQDPEEDQEEISSEAPKARSTVRAVWRVCAYQRIEVNPDGHEEGTVEEVEIEFSEEEGQVTGEEDGENNDSLTKKVYSSSSCFAPVVDYFRGDCTPQVNWDMSESLLNSLETMTSEEEDLSLSTYPSGQQLYSF